MVALHGCYLPHSMETKAVTIEAEVYLRYSINFAHDLPLPSEPLRIHHLVRMWFSCTNEWSAVRECSVHSHPLHMVVLRASAHYNDAPLAVGGEPDPPQIPFPDASKPRAIEYVFSSDTSLTLKTFRGP